MLGISNDVAGLVIVALLIWTFVLALRSDHRLSRRFEQRIAALERSNRRAYSRIGQLEDAMRAAGVTVPSWSDVDLPDEPDDSPPTRTRGKLR
jgi:hypothetical protein